MMRFYKNAHTFYAGIDLHARTLYLCITDADGNKRLHRELKCRVDELQLALAPFREGLVVACETTFCWYWLADFCHERDITFVLGHALFMKAIHGGKAKDDRRFGRKLGVQLRGLISIVSHQTFMRWIREKEASHAVKKATRPRKPGRPRTPEDIRELVLKLARENDWGYTRILGELRKLGIRSISRQTVKTILKEHDIDPGPQRGKGSWEARLRRRTNSEEAGEAAVAKSDPCGDTVAMRFPVQADVDSKRPGRRVPAGVSAPWQPPSLDFTEHRTPGFSDFCHEFAK